MCFGGGTPNYTKKDYGALPSLGTGSASKTVTLNKAPAPMRGSRSGSSSSLIDETMAAAQASSKSGGGIGSIRPPKKTGKKNSLLRETYLNITSPFMKG